MNVVLVGHRGTGKTTIGAVIANELEWPLADLDACVETAHGSAAAALVRQDEAAFRELEIEALGKVLERTRGIIASGGGLRWFGDDTLVIWVEREGWDETALAERERLRPDVSWEEEREWMITTREPVWQRAAHLHYRIPRGRSPGVAGAEIAELIRWCEPDPSSRLRQTMWVVAEDHADFERAGQIAELFGFAGVEARSDRFRSVPSSDIPSSGLPSSSLPSSSLPSSSIAVLASLRTDDPAWLRACEDAAAFDIDCQFVPAAENAGLFEGAPRPLILSTHPARLNPDDVGALARAARRIQDRYPAWLDHLTLKYAPQIEHSDEIGMGRAMLDPLRRAGLPVTFLPQGAPWAWVRPILAGENATHYVSTHLRGERAGERDPSALTPFDIQDWLPHIAGSPAHVFDALIGDPVDHSRGDLWHRSAALRAGAPTGYVKVRVGEDELGATLAAFESLGVRGVSVTSPLKRRISFVCPDDASFGTLLSAEEAARAASRGLPVRTGNTLVRAASGWLATDTDEQGMAACLDFIERAGTGPGTVALLGRGGVAPAVLRAIEASDWFVVVHASARDGWPENGPSYVTLVIDAAGPDIDALTNAPRCDAWLDLHYRGVAAQDGARLHLNGDLFYEAQAVAQRSFWASRSPREET